MTKLVEAAFKSALAVSPQPKFSFTNINLVCASTIEANSLGSCKESTTIGVDVWAFIEVTVSTASS